MGILQIPKALGQKIHLDLLLACLFGSPKELPWVPLGTNSHKILVRHVCNTLYARARALILQTLVPNIIGTFWEAFLVFEGKVFTPWVVIQWQPPSVFW